jgi:4,5-DOPA dioxygenase extradiol
MIGEARRVMTVRNEGAPRAQVVYFSHGGGPLPILGDPRHKAMIDFIKALPLRLTRPDAIVVVSAHWEERVVTLLGGHHPPMFYDYYGFPEESYEITYPAPGNPALAERIAEELRANEIPCAVDRERGFDHGLFVPLKMMYPNADIPSIQISLMRGLNPSAHIALGKALRSFMNENILVVGSGFSFHNMEAFSWTNVPDEPDRRNDAFQDWLIETCTTSIPHHDREHRLVEWSHAPSARYCHSREEHLLPLHVCVGMTEEPGTLVFDDYIFGKRAVAFLW